MPVFEALCQSCGRLNENFLRHWDDPDPACSVCGGATKRMASRFGVPLSGSVHKYMDLNKEGAHNEGIWEYRKVSSISGQPEPVYLQTMEEIRDFRRAEGLSALGETPTTATMSADGKTINSDGMPGNWRGGCMPSIPSRVWDMDRSLTSLNGKTPAPVASGPKVTIQAVDATMMDKFASEAGNA